MIAKIVNSLRENFKSKLNLRSYQEIDCKYSKQFTKELHSLLKDNLPACQEKVS